MTAPVRETTAQALGTALLPLRLPALRGVVGLLGRLVTAPVWEVRHGGLLALKYLLAARPDAAQELLPDAVPAAMVGLKVCAARGQGFWASEARVCNQMCSWDVCRVRWAHVAA